ncbi:MAG: hypothetical protein JW991_02945 [Candidatus Pacebacteria bacterium]|nr:hypothetical protein [Candidatus Paceibacterota bacterium]
MKKGFRQKVLSAPLLILIAILTASSYGALHNQFSFTISPEYFTELKFVQFGIRPDLPRLGAALVGIKASWWLGLIMALPITLLGLIHQTLRKMFRSTLKSFGLVLLTVLIGSLVGFIWGSVKFPRNRFDMAGTMHNFSYLGAFLGLPLGLFYQVSCRSKKRT